MPQEALTGSKMPSKLEQLQQQYRRQLLQEKEERMIKIHTDSQQKALSKVARYIGVVHQAPAPPAPHHSPVKKGSPGVDRSRPLPPITPKERNPRTSPEVAKVSSRSKSVELVESRSDVQERRPDPEALARLRQAELQRLRAKARDETPPPRSNGAISKSSAVQKKTPAARPTPPNARSRPPPPPTTQAATSRKAAVPSSRNAAPSRGRAPVAPPPGRKPPGPGQEQCAVCGRNFNADRIEKHVSICSKAAKKKVKVFDATKMRVKGTEAEQFVKKGPLPKSEPLKAKKTDWRKQHEEFIEAIRQAKMVQQHLAKGGKVSDLPPPPPSDHSDYVPCQYCGRKFSPGVADRHIPKCKNILSNKKSQPRKK